MSVETTLPITRKLDIDLDNYQQLELRNKTWILKKNSCNIFMSKNYFKSLVFKDSLCPLIAQIVINLFLFNKIDMNNLLVTDNEVALFLDNDQTVLIPPLPNNALITCTCTLGGALSTKPLIRFIKENNENNEKVLKKRIRIL